MVVFASCQIVAGPVCTFSEYVLILMLRLMLVSLSSHLISSNFQILEPSSSSYTFQTNTIKRTLVAHHHFILAASTVSNSLPFCKSPHRKLSTLLLQPSSQYLPHHLLVPPGVGYTSESMIGASLVRNSKPGAGSSLFSGHPSAGPVQHHQQLLTIPLHVRFDVP